MSVIFITHDLGVIAEIADQVAVMYAGRDRGTGSRRRTVSASRCTLIRAACWRRCRSCSSTEVAAADDRRHGAGADRVAAGVSIFESVCARNSGVCNGTGAGASESRALGCVSSLERTRVSTPLLEVRGLTKHFPVRGGVLLRRVGISARGRWRLVQSCNRGETLGLVGESGCGKSTVGKTLLRLHRAVGGIDLLRRHGHHSLGTRAELRALRREIQIVFQDPFESLNARHSVGRILEEPFIVHRLGTAAERRRWVVGAARDGRFVERRRATLSARIFRRAAAAHRHCASNRAAPEADRLRRSGFRARCIDPVAGAEPAAGICSAK